jgi:hypothetical protein
MEFAAILQAVSGLAALYGQVAPLVGELQAAMQSNDPAQLDALLAKIQAENDRLGTA